jgi:DNA-directed RNA polymerase sigma subunit (sigma70/sigma32)
MELRYGVPPKTLSEIAEQLDMSRERARMLLAEAEATILRAVWGKACDRDTA